MDVKSSKQAICLAYSTVFPHVTTPLPNCDFIQIHRVVTYIIVYSNIFSIPAELYVRKSHINHNGLDRIWQNIPIDAASRSNDNHLQANGIVRKTKEIYKSVW